MKLWRNCYKSNPDKGVNNHHTRRSLEKKLKNTLIPKNIDAGLKTIVSSIVNLVMHGQHPRYKSDPWGPSGYSVEDIRELGNQLKQYVDDIADALEDISDEQIEYNRRLHSYCKKSLGVICIDDYNSAENIMEDILKNLPADHDLNCPFYADVLTAKKRLDDWKIQYDERESQ